MATFLEIATPLIQRGIPVIPVQPNEKRCLLPEWQKKATTDINVVRQWNQENPQFNVGCVGKLEGFVMLDCDVVGLRQQIENETGQKFPRTLIVKSAGKGAEHIYFRQTDRTRGLGNRSSAALFDLQSVDKYVVGAGSKLSNGKTYEVVDDSPIADFPDWLADWIDRHSDVSKEHHGGKGAPVHPDFDFDRFCDHFDFTFVGDNDGKYFFEACPYKGDHHTKERGQPDYAACCLLVAESSFASFRQIAYVRVGQFAGTGAWLGKIVLRPAVELAFLYGRITRGVFLTDASPENAVVGSRVPILLIHGLSDNNIPFQQSEWIHSHNPADITLWEVPGAGHCGAVSVVPQEFDSRVLGWFSAHDHGFAPTAVSSSPLRRKANTIAPNRIAGSQIQTTSF